MIVGIVINEDSKGRNALPPVKVRAVGVLTSRARGMGEAVSLQDRQEKRIPPAIEGRRLGASEQISEKQ